MATWFGSCFGGLLSTRRSPPPPASPPAALLQAVAPRKAPLTPRVCAAAAANGNSNGNSSSSVTAAPPQQQRAPQPGAAPPLLTHWLPIAVLTDSYKTTHFVQYPDARKMVAYAEFRTGYDKDTADTRVLWYGIRYIVENYLNRQWTVEDVERADVFFKTHMAPGYTAFPYPRDLMLKFVAENNGYMPVKLEALPEGTAIHAHVPVYQITAKGEYAPLCTFLETLLTMVWYPTTVATLSRRCKDNIAAAFERSVDGGAASPLLNSRLHDFGFRGCSCLEQSVLGGVAHLLNFDGTDTLSAAYYAQFALNGGRPVGQSIPATEHSVMTAWPTEAAAISNMIQHFGTGIFATVMDSYDYEKALAEVLPAVRAEKMAAGGFWVLRPDSGDPIDAVVAGLRAADKTFGSDVNGKGFKVPRGVGVIQGDGINYRTIRALLEAVLEAGFSAQSVAFGMGGGLLQRVNRDTLNFATKLSQITYADGRVVDVLKAPKTDPMKGSLPGVLAVKRVGGVPTVYGAEQVAPEDNLLRVVYDKGPVAVEWEEFDALRQRAEREWNALPPTAEVISEELKAKRQRAVAQLHAKAEAAQ